MTKNQIDYANYLENKRKNLKQEDISERTLAETNRHNLVSEAQTDYSNQTTRSHYERMDAETQRHNIINENETSRHNQVTEQETARSNLAKENETARHNAETERLADLQLEEQQWMNAQQAKRIESQNLVDSMNRTKMFSDMQISHDKLPLDYINTGANVVNSLSGIFGNVSKLGLLIK